MIYYALFSFFLLASLFMLLARGKYRIDKLEKFLFWTGTIVLFILAAFRVNVGNDYKSYQNIFEGLHDTSISLQDRIYMGEIEPGYIIFNLLAPNYRCLIILITFCQIWLSCKFFYKQNCNRLLCLFMFYASTFLFYDMGIMRQGLAIAISYSGLRYIKERNLKKYLLIIILALMFHVTAIFMLPLYWIGKREFSRKTYYGIVLLSVVLTTFMYQIVVWIGQMGIPYISYKIQYYASNYFTQNRYYLSIVKRIVIGIFFIEIFKHTANRILGDFNGYFKMKKYLLNCPQDDVWLYINGYMLSLIVFIFFSLVPFLGTRGSAGLCSLQIPIFAKMADGKKNRWFNIIVFFIITVLFFYTMQNTLASPTGNYIPYKSILL